VQYAGKDIHTISTLELLQAYNGCVAKEQEREQASKHQKFNSLTGMKFPPINPVFVQMKNEIKAELEKRNITVSK